MKIQATLQEYANYFFPRLYSQLKLVVAARRFTTTGSPWSINCLEDESLRSIIRHTLKGGGSGIDIGASVGDFTAVMAGTSKNNVHHAFEANPAIAETLRRRFMGKNIIVHDVALSSEPGISNFYVSPKNTGIGGLRITPVAAKEGRVEEIKVIVKKLDDYLEHINRCRIIKLDIEGAELLVLLGAQQLILRDKPLVYFECAGFSDVYGHGIEDIYDFFASIGYEIRDPFSYLGKLAPLSKGCFFDRVSNRRNFNFVAVYPNAYQIP